MWDEGLRVKGSPPAAPAALPLFSPRRTDTRGVPASSSLRGVYIVGPEVGDKAFRV